MIAYLDTLCLALRARDGTEIRRLLRHPLARALPPGVRAEALAIARAGADGQAPPVRALHFMYQTLQLMASRDAEMPDEGPEALDDAFFVFHHEPGDPHPAVAMNR
jgi:hypothetical protein